MNYSSPVQMLDRYRRREDRDRRERGGKERGGGRIVRGERGEEKRRRRREDGERRERRGKEKEAEGGS